MLGGLIGRSEAIDLHRSPAAPMVRCWDLGTIWDNKIAPLFVQILRMFSSWIGDDKQVHIVVVERESAFRTVIKEAMLQSAGIDTYVPIKSKMESSSLSLFSGFCEDPRRFISDMVEGFLSSGFEETWDWWQDAKGLKQKEC